jgi:hypothetical protein
MAGGAEVKKVPKETRLTKCESCKKRRATAGLCRSFYVLKMAVPTTFPWQIKGGLPTVGYCGQCLLDLAMEAGAGDSVLDLLRDVCCASESGGSVCVEAKRKSAKVKLGTRGKEQVS